MTHRLTRHAFRSSQISTSPKPISMAKARIQGSDGESSSSADESGGEAWNSKNDGVTIKQSHFGGKRRRSGKERRRGKDKGVKQEKQSPSARQRRKKRVKSESTDELVKEESEGEVRNGDEIVIETSDEGKEEEDEGNQAEVEDDLEIQEAEPTTRRSGRARNVPQRFDEVKFKPYGILADSASQANVAEAMGRLKQARGGPSRPRPRSPSGSPDPIASFSDEGYMAVDNAEPQAVAGISSGMIDTPAPPSDDPPPKIPEAKNQKPTKSALKPKKQVGPRKKRSKVTIDESKNQIRTIKVISSTSSDIGRSPSTPFKRGPKKFGIRSRKTIPVFGVSPDTGKKAVKGYEYVVSSDSETSDETESEDEDKTETYPGEFQRWIRSRREREIVNTRMFLLSLAAKLVVPPSDSSSISPPRSVFDPQTQRLEVLNEGFVLSPIVLNPIRPRPLSSDLSLEDQATEDQEMRWEAFVDTSVSAWDKKNKRLLQQVVTFRPPPLSLAEKANVTPLPMDTAADVPTQENNGEDSRETRQEILSLARQSSAEDPIPRPPHDFEKARDRLAGLTLAKHGMGLRLHLPEKKTTRF